MATADTAQLKQRVAENVAGDATHIRAGRKRPLPDPQILAEEQGDARAAKVEQDATYLWNIPILAAAGGWLVKNTEGKKWLAPVRWVGKALSAPHKIVETHTLGDAPHVVSGTVRKAAEVTGAKTLSNVGENIALAERKVTGAVGSAASDGLGAVGGVMDTAVERAGLDGWRIRHAVNLKIKAAAARANAGTTYKGAFAHLEAAEKALPGDKFAKARAVLAETRALLNSDGNAPETFSINKTPMADRARMIGEQQEKFAKALAEAGVKAPRGAHPASWLNGKAHPAHTHFKNFAKAVTEAEGHLERATSLASKADFRENLAEGFRNIPGNLAQMKGDKVLQGGIYAGMQGVAAYRTTRALTGGMAALKDIYAHVKGVDASKVSTWKILAGGDDLPPVVQEARRQYFRSALPRAAAGIIGMVAFHKIMGRNTSMATQFLGYGVQAGAMGAGELLAGHNRMLDAYDMIRHAQAHGQDVPKAAYIALMVHASPKVRAMDEDDRNLLRVAAQYAKEQMSPGAVLRKLDSGAFDKEYAAMKAAHPVKPAAPSAPQPATAHAEPPDAVIGPHTAAAVAEGRGPLPESARAHVEQVAAHRNAAQAMPSIT